MNARTHFPQDVPDRLAFHLENWADYMRSGGTRGLKAPSSSSGFVGGGYNNDFDSMVLAADRQAAEIMDALIAGLSPVRQAAVNHKYLCAVYRFPRGNLEGEFQAACVILEAGMAARGLV